MRAGAETVEWIRSYYELIDNGRLEETRSYLTPDATIQVAHHAPMVGADRIVASMTAGLSTVRGIRHELIDAWEEDDGVLIFVVHAHYDLGDGSDVVVPGTVIAKVDDGRFSNQRIYADLTTVYGRGR